MTQLLGSKGLLGYIDGTIAKPVPQTAGTTTPDPTPVYSMSPNSDEWTFRDQLVQGHITLNCTDVASLGVVTTGTAKDAWDSIKNEWGKSTDMRHSHAQELLNKTVYVKETDIQDHVKLLHTRRATVDNLNTSAMADETWKGIIIRSIPPMMKWLLVIPSLYVMTTPADIFLTLLAHGMILDRGNESKPTSGISNTVLAAKTSDPCTNPNCKAKKRSTHNTANCYWPGGGKEGQFPPNFGQRTKANTASTPAGSSSEHFVLSARVVSTPGASGVLIHEDIPFMNSICEETRSFILSTNIPKTPGNSGVIIHEDDSTPMALVSKSFQGLAKNTIPTFMDSGVSDTMFVSKEAFAEYTTTSPQTGDTAKAVDGGFDIIGKGKVTQTYLIDGQTKSVTFTCTLHTPALNANLISISSFDRAGLITTFGNGQGVIRKPDSTIVLAGRGDKGMYVVETSHTPRAMGSLSNNTSLEQWHHRFSHCNPTTIHDMAKSNLVDGLKISKDSVQGKCEDCILGRQTRRPFDNESDKSLDPLELVAFDLWGPSHVQSGGGKLYFMPIVDAGSSYKHGAYLNNKSDVSTIAAFDVFRAKAESLTGRKIRRLRTDWAYESAAWEEYCRRHSIIHEFTASYLSAQNGLAEHAIRTTMDDVRTLLHDSGLPHSYWAEAVAFSIETRNLIPSHHHPGKIPLESFSGKRQDVSHLCVFGARCWAKIPTVNGALISGGSKLNERGVECRFLGYATGYGNYKVQDSASWRVFVSRDVIFEKGMPHRTLPSVGENIPLFDTIVDTPLGNNRNSTNQSTYHADRIQINSRNTWTITLIIALIILFQSLSNHANLPECLNPQTRLYNLGNTNNAKNLDEVKGTTGPPAGNNLMHHMHSIEFLLSKTTTSPV